MSGFPHCNTFPPTFFTPPLAKMDAQPTIIIGVLIFIVFLNFLLCICKNGQGIFTRIFRHFRTPFRRAGRFGCPGRRGFRRARRIHPQTEFVSKCLVGLSAIACTIKSRSNEFQSVSCRIRSY